MQKKKKVGATKWLVPEDFEEKVEVKEEIIDQERSCEGSSSSEEIILRKRTDVRVLMQFLNCAHAHCETKFDEIKRMWQ